MNIDSAPGRGLSPNGLVSNARGFTPRSLRGKQRIQSDFSADDVSRAQREIRMKP